MKSSESHEPELAGVVLSEGLPAIEENPAPFTPWCARCRQDTGIEDARLVAACLQGDQQAWETLIDKYKRLIYSIPFRYGASPEDAADVFQSVCIEVLNSLSQLKNTDSLRPAHHRCRPAVVWLEKEAVQSSGTGCHGGRSRGGACRSS